MKNRKIKSIYYLFIFILCFTNISNLPTVKNELDKTKEHSIINSVIKAKKELNENENKSRKKKTD